MTNPITLDGYQTNAYGQLIINGEIVMHDTDCLAVNSVYGLYKDGTRFKDPNTVDPNRLGLIATSSYQNETYHIGPIGFIEYPLCYNNVSYAGKWEPGHNDCVEYFKQEYPDSAGDESYYILYYTILQKMAVPELNEII